MILSLNALVPMAWRTVKNPREGAAEVLSLGFPREAIWSALALVVVISIMLAFLGDLITPDMPGTRGMLLSPAAMGFIQLLLMLVMIFAVFWIGRAMGGTGSLEETALLVIWLQFIMICLQVAQTAALLVIPPLAGMIGVFGLVLFLWLLTNFIAVLHGFSSLIQVFIMILVAAFGIAFGLSIILTIIGISVPVVEGA